jgi:hypothetical protein
MLKVRDIILAPFALKEESDVLDNLFDRGLSLYFS